MFTSKRPVKETAIRPLSYIFRDVSTVHEGFPGGFPVTKLANEQKPERGRYVYFPMTNLEKIKNKNGMLSSAQAENSRRGKTNKRRVLFVS